MGVISTFYFALLTGRAFTLTTAYEGMQPFEVAYFAPNINWTTKHEYVVLIPKGGSSNEDGPPARATPQFQLFNAINPEFRSDIDGMGVIDMFLHMNLSEQAYEKEIVFMTLNRGTSVRLFDNPHHADQLRNMGLTPETAFGCAMNYLFEPIPEVMESIEPEIALLRASGTLSIGLHVRMGDHVLHGDDRNALDIGKYNNFFDCAQQIEDALLQKEEASAKVVWLLISDSHALRQHASETYGAKLITRLNRKLEHSFGHQYTNTKAHASIEGFLEAVGEHWLFGLTDKQVVDKDSGYGQSAAYRSFRKGSIFFVSSGVQASCKIKDAVTIKTVGYNRAGVKLRHFKHR